MDYKKKYLKYYIKYKNLKGGMDPKLLEKIEIRRKRLQDTEKQKTPLQPKPNKVKPPVAPKPNKVKPPVAPKPFRMTALQESLRTLEVQQPDRAEELRRVKIERFPRFITDIKRDYEYPNRFIVFTTGIADNRLRNFWLSNNLHLHILSLIPPYFTEVKFIHFDPDIAFDQSPAMGINESDIIKINMQASDHERIIESSFYKDFFPYTNIDFTRLNHLVIDFAHLFKYVPHSGGIVKTSGHYREQNPGGEPINGMKSVYFLYDDIFKNYTTTFFIFNERMQVITYIDKMIELELIEDPSYPMESINKLIYTFIREELYQESKKFGIPMDDFDTMFIYNDEFKSNLTITFINNFLWISRSRKEILDRFISHIKSEFYFRISRKNDFIRE